MNATYQCGTGITCAGTVPSGSAIDTSTSGLHTFVVQALDADGNVIASLQRTYLVNYLFKGFFAPVDNLPTLNVAKAGSAIPVKFSLTGNQGLVTAALKGGTRAAVSAPCPDAATAPATPSTRAVAATNAARCGVLRLIPGQNSMTRL